MSDEQIQQSRREQRPKVGARVLYPVPFPPVAHNEEDGKLREVAVPTGDEQWFSAKVVAVEHAEHTTDPDDYLAVLEPDEGFSVSVSVVFLREDT